MYVEANSFWYFELIHCLCLLSGRIWEHLSSHRRWADLLYHLCSAGNSLIWILIGWSRGPVGDHFWEGHRKSRENDCGELLFFIWVGLIAPQPVLVCNDPFLCRQHSHIWRLNYPADAKVPVKLYYQSCYKLCYPKLKNTKQEKKLFFPGITGCSFWVAWKPVEGRI